MRITKSKDSIAYGSLTYRDIFEGGNVIDNHDFTNGLTNWNLGANFSGVVSNNVLRLETINDFPGSHFISSTAIPVLSNVYYWNIRLNPSINSTHAVRIGSNPLAQSFNANIFSNFSGITTANDTIAIRYRYDLPIILGTVIFLDYYYAINLTALGLASLTKAQMDTLFAEYQAIDSVEVGSMIESTTLTTGTHLRVHLPSKNDIPVAELNGLTLNEVFEGGNFINNPSFDSGTANWSIANATGSVANGIYTFTTNAASGRIFQNPTPMILNNVYYFTSLVKSSSSSTQVSISGVGSASHSGSNNYEMLSNSFTWTAPTGNYLARVQNNLNIITQIEADYFYLYNLTALNLTSLTQAQLDAYFSQYQANKDGNFMARDFTEYDDNSVPIAELNGLTLDEVFDRKILTNITALPNNVKYYEISSGNIVQRVQEYTLKSTDFTFVDTARPNVDYAIAYLDTLSIPLLDFFNVTIDGKSFVENYTEISSTTLFSNGKIGDYYTNNEALWISIPKGTTLTQARDLLNGTNILYQLATPITLLTGVSLTQAQLDWYYERWLRSHKTLMQIHTPSGNNIPIAELNGLTLNEVFDDGNFINLPFTDINNNNVFDDGFSDGGPTVSFVDGVQFLETSFNNVYIRKNIETFTLNHKYYVNFYAKKINNTSGAFTIGFGTSSFISLNRTTYQSILFDNFDRYSHIQTITSLGSSNNTQLFLSGISGISSNVMFNDLYVINLTALNLTSLTKAQLDYYFKIYTFNKANTIVAKQFKEVI